MRSGQCDHCGAETSHGLALCGACQGMFLVRLEYVPVYFRNLSRWRPSSAAGIRDVPGSREPRAAGSASGDRVGRILDESHADLTGWARTLADDRPELAPVIHRILTMDAEPCVRLLCALLTRRVATLTTLPWVRDIVHGVVTMERRLRVETERSVPGWYAGACARCGSSTYVVPGLTWVTCNGIIGYTKDDPPRPVRCGMTTAARDHLEVILDEARDWVARPKPLAEALVALLDSEASVPRLYERIHKWGNAKPPRKPKLTPVVAYRRAHVFDLETESIVVGEEPAGAPRYRFGDVFDLLMSSGATRPVATSSDCRTTAC